MLLDYILFSIIFVAVDGIFLKTFANYFNNQIKLVQNKPLKLNYISTFLCYLTLSIGIYYFAIVKNLSLIETFGLGIFVYGVYEFTTHALLENWKWKTVMIDTVWGGILFATTVYLFKKIKTMIK